jgi:hypothetical protein
MVQATDHPNVVKLTKQYTYGTWRAQKGCTSSIDPQIVAKDHSGESGVFPPEAYFKLSELTQALKSRNVTVEETTSPLG